MKKYVNSILALMLASLIGCAMPVENHQEENPTIEVDPYEGYEKITSLSAEHADVNILIYFDDVLYAKSYVLIDYAGGGEPIGVIDKLIDKEYVPQVNGETNTEEILNATLYDKAEKSIIVFYNNVYRLFEVIEK